MAKEIKSERDLKKLKLIALKGKEIGDFIENAVKEIEPILKDAYLTGEIPFEIEIRIAVSAKILKPKST